MSGGLIKRIYYSILAETYIRPTVPIIDLCTLRCAIDLAVIHDSGSSEMRPITGPHYI